MALEAEPTPIAPSSHPELPETPSRLPALPAARTAGDLIRGITQDLSTIVSKEIELAKAEVSEILKSKMRAAAIGALGLILAGLMIPLLLLTLIEVLAIWLDRWAATLIVTLVVGAAAGLAFLVAKRFFDKKFVPEKTVQSLKEDVKWARDLRKH
jgi:uncharacterized membrane protein YqjE